MAGGSRLLSVRPVDAICRCADWPPTLGPPGENTADELPPEQPASSASVADAPSAARIMRNIAIKSDYHFCSLWSAPRKTSIVGRRQRESSPRILSVLGTCHNRGNP